MKRTERKIRAGWHAGSGVPGRCEGRAASQLRHAQEFHVRHADPVDRSSDLRCRPAAHLRRQAVRAAVPSLSRATPGLFHLLGEVEVVFGFWAIVLVLAMALSSQAATQRSTYAESRNYTEPLFVFVVMVIAASRPVLRTVMRVGRQHGPCACRCRTPLATAWLGLAAVPLLGLADHRAGGDDHRRPDAGAADLPAAGARERQVPGARRAVRQRLDRRHAHLVRRAAGADGGGHLAMGQRLHARAPSAGRPRSPCWSMRRSRPSCCAGTCSRRRDQRRRARVDARVPLSVVAVHLALLARRGAVRAPPGGFPGPVPDVPRLHAGLRAPPEPADHQGGIAGRRSSWPAWWCSAACSNGGCSPSSRACTPLALFFGALGLTAITDNAALTYLGSLIAGISDEAKYMLVAGAVAGGGLTVIANAPNPAGVALAQARLRGRDDRCGRPAPGAPWRRRRWQRQRSSCCDGPVAPRQTDESRAGVK